MGKKFIVYLLAISMLGGNADYTVLAAEETVCEAAESTDEAQDNEETEANTEEERIENPSSDVETELQNFETSESEDAKEETEEETEESLTEESLTDDNTVLGAEEVTIVQVEMQGVYEYGDSPLDYQKQYGDSIVYSMRSNNVVEYAYQEIMMSYEAGGSGAEITVSEHGFSSDKSSIYSVDFDGSNKKTEFTADTTTGYIYGSALRQGKVYYCLRQKPSITANETVLTADIRFNTKKYTITFDADNGFVDISHKTVLPNKACGTLPIPKRDGYNFAGWYTERNGTGERITAETIITQSITLYAKWVGM